MRVLKYVWVLQFATNCECFVDLVDEFGGRATMTGPPFYDYVASNAINGDTGAQKLCAVMDVSGGYQSVWWKVWLQRNFNVAEIKIHFQPATIYRSTGFSIYVFDNESFIPPNDVTGRRVYQHDPSTGCPLQHMTIIVNRATHGIAFYNTRQRVLQSNCDDKSEDRQFVEICEVNVLGCDVTHYSESCSHECDRRCLNQHCDSYNGECIYGCSEPHRAGPHCTDCQDGYYGENCTQECGHCKEKQYCDKTTGFCSKGCLLHWNEPKCDICADGYYGDNCTLRCGHCKDNVSCNQTGHCPESCTNDGHWQYPRCQECVIGFYGETCTQQCGYCLGINDCNKTTGVCSNGCQSHWNGSTCGVCADGYYGDNCTLRCGQCKDNMPCNQTGHCPANCSDIGQWQFPKCQECAEKFYGIHCNVTCGQCKGGGPCDKKSGECNSGFVEQTSTISAVAGGIAGGLLLLAVMLAILIFIRRRRMGKKSENYRNSSPPAFGLKENRDRENKYQEDNPDIGSIEEQEATVDRSLDGDYYNIASVNSCIRVDDFQRIIAKKNDKKTNIFALEYKRLPTGNTEICGTAQRPENVSKNRFKTTFPYEHSRVVLEEKWNPFDNDYINANYIKDKHGNPRFIAAQGPTKNTIEDFWRMMWQENIKTVVMLTNIVENGKNKCSKYWPDKNQPMDIGPCTVTLTEENVYCFYVVRKLCVENKEAIRKHTITQYHYTAWPDHGTPEEISLIQFHRAVLKTHQRRSPLLVHCSAGVGRTGTFIALDTLLEEGWRSGEVDVLEFVKSMREDRMTMVQTVEQYVFLHKALLDGLQGCSTAISESDFQLKAKNMLEDTSPLNQRQVYCEFKKLLTLKPAYHDEEKEDSKTPENLTKNVSVDILPVSKHRPYLATYVKGRNDYINAVIVPSFTSPIGFIITQKPLVDTEVDLWRMCMDHETDGIVVLNNKDEENTWIPSRGSSRTVPPFNITAKDTGSTMNDVIQGVIGVSDQDRHRSIDTFQLPAKDDESILKGIELLLEKTKSSAYRTIVMSTDGAGAAGIFCAVHNAVQELRRDGEIDLFTIVRQIHVRRPEVIGKLDEYRRCYSLLMTLLEAQGIYANL